MLPLPALAPAAWVLLAAAALVVGAAKTSVQNLVFFSVAAFALVLPARTSTAAVVGLLVVADAVAVLRFHPHCDWALLRRLLPFVIPGEALGMLFLAWVDDHVLKVLIGVLLLALLAPQVLELLRRHRRAATAAAPHEDAAHLGPVATGLVGTAAGFTTMAANVAGPIFTWYLLLLRVDKRRFVGTGAVFFAVVNILKVPAGAAIDLFTPEILALDAVLIPLVLLGSLLGGVLLRRLSQRSFDLLAVGMSLVGAAALLLGR